MDFLLAYNDLQHIVGIKIIFFAFILLGIIGIYKKWSAVFFLWLIGLCSAAAYYLLSNDLALPLWGLKGDEITIAAMYEMFAHGSLASDFAYAGLPAFYPPLFFWIFAIPGRFLDMNGVQMMKLGAITTFALFPIGFYLIQKWFWSRHTDKKNPGKVAWFFSTIALLLFTDMDQIITKPYELVSASCIVVWATALVYLLHTKKLNAKNITMLAITGGILFMMFYFWFALIAIAIALFNVFAKKSIGVKGYGWLFLLGILILAVGSPFWWPLAHSYGTLGSENWQLGFFVIPWIATHAPDMAFNLRALLSLFGFGVLIWFRDRLFVRSVLSVVAAGYMWQLMGLVTILLLASPLQETKGFAFFMTTAFALGAGYGLEQLYKKYAKGKHIRKHMTSAAIIGWLILSVHMLFGSFVDINVVYNTRNVAKEVDYFEQDLISFFKDTNRDVYNSVNLQSGIVELHAFLPWHDFIYFNMHNSHPAALFSERLNVVKDLARAQTSQEFYEIIQNNDISKIDRLVFFKGEGDSYSLYYHLDNFPYASNETSIGIKKDLVTDEYFDIVYESEKYIVFETK